MRCSEKHTHDQHPQNGSSFRLAGGSLLKIVRRTLRASQKLSRQINHLHGPIR